MWRFQRGLRKQSLLRKLHRGYVDADDMEAVRFHELANPKVLKIPGLLGNRGTTLKDKDHMLAKA